MDKLFELKIRQKIFSLISNNPGLHASKIASVLNIEGQLADYHLLYLERNDIIVAIKKGGYKRYYVKGKIGKEERKFLSILRQEIPLKIVLFLLKNPGSMHKEILSHLEISASTLSYHLKKLLKSDIIFFDCPNNSLLYYVKNKDDIIKILVRYKPYSWIDNFSDMWKDFFWK